MHAKRQRWHVETGANPHGWSLLSPQSSVLSTLATRVRLRWLVEWARRGLLGGLAGAAVVGLGGRLLGQGEWPAVAVLGGLLAFALAMALALARWPDEWATARAADGLGLAERVTSAIFAERVGHPAAPLLVADAVRALERADPSTYAIVERPHRWRAVLLAGLAVAVAAAVPLPPSGPAAQQAAEARAVLAARQRVEALRASVAPAPVPAPLARAAADELQALEEQLARARTAEEAAQAVERAQERLAGLASAEDYGWRRALDRLAGALAGQPDLDALARALRANDGAAVERALAELAEGAAAMSPEERQQLQLALQAGANAAREAPELAGALRQAASQTGQANRASGDPASSQAEAAAAIEKLAPLLAQGANRSAGLQATQRALSGLGQTRASLGQPGSTAGRAGAAAGGPPTGSASSGQAGAGGQAGATGDASSAGSSASSRGDSTGSASASGSGSGAGTGTGSSSGGSGAGSGSGSGRDAAAAGGDGRGAGVGAGAGGGPAPGQPGAGNAGPTAAGGNAAPSNRGATTYDPIYAPSLLGGSGGPQVQAPGDPAGAGGETVELPDSPKALGALRPYDQVYGQYEAAARQSLSRQSLPPGLQGLVQRYFSAIDPNPKSGSE